MSAFVQQMRRVYVTNYNITLSLIVNKDEI